MSLRAKIEAVVYAAEEPVTLAQLAAVFGPDVREIWQAERQEEAVTTEVEESSGEAASTEAVPEPTGDGQDPDEPRSGAQIPLDGEAAAKRAVRNEDRAIRDHLRKMLDALRAELEEGDRGVEIREIAGGYRMATRPEYHDSIRSFVKSLKPPMKLSLQALETLAVVAYKQPVTGPEIGEIRGVESTGVLGSLLARKLITTAGRKQVIGRPILYKTTKEFLVRFGLKDLNELPSIEEFEKMAGELADADLEPVTEGGLTTSEAERSLNEDDDESEAEEGDTTLEPAAEDISAEEPALQEQKAGEA